MASIGRTATTLRQYRIQWERLSKAQGFPSPIQSGAFASPSRLKEVTGFGSNPGALRMKVYVPAQLAPSPALVVVLHGCTQTADGYDHGAGWSKLADIHGFAVLYPEQQPANNPKSCFTWFSPDDTRRGAGEALSIRQMVETMSLAHGIDRSRVFVTGLSAGGAMTSVMLATYPDVFAAGAIISGLPYGAAGNVQEAFQSMFQSPPRPPRALGDAVRAASPHEGPWPRVSVWHGSADTTVVPANAAEIVKQWSDVHGVNPEAFSEDRVGRQRRRTWRDGSGQTVIEEYIIPNLSHGTPLDTRPGAAGAGVAGPFLLEAGISSTWHIARFWGLTDAVMPAPKTQAAAEWPDHETPQAHEIAATRGKPHGFDVQGIITKALEKAGLIR